MKKQNFILLIILVIIAGLVIYFYPTIKKMFYVPKNSTLQIIDNENLSAKIKTYCSLDINFSYKTQIDPVDYKKHINMDEGFYGSDRNILPTSLDRWGGYKCINNHEIKILSCSDLNPEDYKRDKDKMMIGVGVSRLAIICGKVFYIQEWASAGGGFYGPFDLE